MIGLYMATENPGLHRLDDRFITVHTFINYMVLVIAFLIFTFVCRSREQDACDAAVWLLLFGHQMFQNFIYMLNADVNKEDMELSAQNK
jgi:hypothetical protein